MLTTPGSRVASEVQSRPFNGNSRMVVESTVPPIVDDDSCTVGAVLVTSTVSDTLPRRRT